MLIHHWLVENHFDLARRLAPEIFPETPEQRWQAILNERARTDKFRLVLVPQIMGILERESQLKLANTTIRLGERFCFELESEEEGFVIALQGVRGQWHNIPLGPNGEASAPIQSGQNRLPKTQDGKLDPLVEQHDEGVHTFVLIFSEAPDIPSNIAQLGAWRKASCIVHSTTVKFIS